MILKHIEWDFDIYINGINTLVIENPFLFRKVLCDLNNQINCLEGGFTLFKDLEEKKIDKEFILINSPFLTSINERKILNKLYSEMKDEIISSSYEGFRILESEILSFFNSIIFNNRIELETNECIEIVDLLKIAGVKFKENHDYENIIEGILEYAIIVQEILSPTAIVFINIKGMFIKEEWNLFIKELNLRNINALFVERNSNFSCRNIENIYTIDEDLCEVY